MGEEEERVLIEQRFEALKKIVDIMSALSRDQQVILWKTLATLLDI